jgi:hypothetical protein
VLTGHCSHCHKVWMLETAQGVCQWCGNSASCQTTRTQALRSIKSRSNGRKRQAEPNHNGYDQLQSEWALYYKVTSYFVQHIRFDDREDWLHDTMLEMAKVKAKYELIGKPLTEAGLMRVASYQVTEYWVKQRRLTTWLDCGHCSKAQRQKCRSEDLYSECPKYHQLVSLNGDGDGESSELIEFIADDNAIDLDAWVDARRILRGLPRRLVLTGYKLYSGYPLTDNERKYLYKFRKNQQKSLF